MDPNTDINQDPVAATDTGATSFTPNFDMTAINEAVAAGPAADEIPADPTATPAGSVAPSDPYEPAAAPADPTAAPAEEQPQAPVAGFVDGDLTNDAPVAPTTPEPVATDPVEAFSATPEDTVGEVPIVPQEAEPTTIADLANNTDAPMAAPAAAPVEPIASTEPAAPVTPEPTPAPAPAPIDPTVPAGKSKVPTYVLIGLALVAVVSVVIAVIVSLS